LAEALKRGEEEQKDAYLRHTCRKSVTAHVISRKKTTTAPILQKAAEQQVLIWPF
jgi:hypothetical protein